MVVNIFEKFRWNILTARLIVNVLWHIDIKHLQIWPPKRDGQLRGG